MIEIHSTREAYRGLASEAALEYFIILKLNTIEYTYQYSIDEFISKFLKGVTLADPSDERRNRIANIQTSIRGIFVSWITNGLREEHRLPFLAQIVFELMNRNILDSDCGFDISELKFMLLGTILT